MISQLDPLRKTIAISLGILCFKLHMLYVQYLYTPLYNDNGPWFYNIFYLYHVYLHIFLYKYNKFLRFHMIYCSFVNNLIFFFLKLIIAIAYFLKDYKKLLHTVFTSAYIMLIFYAFK